MEALRYLAGYPPHLLQRVQQLLTEGRLGESISRRHGERHEVRTDRALEDYTNALKARYLRSAPPLHRVTFDSQLQVVRQALGEHARVSRVQGGRLKAKREIRVAALFRDAPAAFLRMIVVHELAHLREPAHDKAFYSLCTHMEADYHQLEFDTRLWLTARELESPRRST